MSKLIFTGKQVDEAIKKVKEGYADVSKVTATASDVRAGKIIVDSNKVKQEGTLSDGEATVSETISSSSILSTDESDYPITFTPKATVTKEGLISSGQTGTAATKYIQTEEKSATPEGEEKVVKPTTGKLMTKVTVAAIPEAQEWPIDNFPCPYFYFYISRSTTSSSFACCQISSGTVANNIYVKSGVDLNDAKVYIFPVTTSVSSTSYFWGTTWLLDSTTHRLKDGIIELKPGESFTNTASIFAPAGVLTYTTAGRLTFTFTASFQCLGPRNDSNENANYGTMNLFLYNGSQYYGVCLDADKWSVGTQYIGSKVNGTTRLYTNRGQPGKPMVADGVSAYNLKAPGCLLSNYSPVYFEWNYVNDSTSYHLACMTHGGGTGYYIPKETKKLNDPVLSVSGTTLSWNEITDAVSYTLVYLLPSTTSTKTVSGLTGTSYDFSSIITTDGTYKFQLRAVGDGVYSDYTTLNYELIRRLDTPSISLSGNTITIASAITDATGYKLYINGSQYTTFTGLTYNIQSATSSAGTYSITVTAYCSGRTDSYVSNAVTVNRLAAPTLTKSGSTVSWTAVTDATYYLVTIDSETISTTSTSYDISRSYDTDSFHTIKVQAKSSTSESITSTCYHIPTPAIYLDDGKIYFTKTSAGTSTYYLYKGGTLYGSFSYSSSGYDLSSACSTAGTYTLTVKGYYGGSYSDSSNSVSFTRLATPEVTVTNMVVSWTSVTSAIEYEVYVDGELHSTITGTSIDFSSEWSSSENHQLKVRALGLNGAQSLYATAGYGNDGSSFETAINVTVGSGDVDIESLNVDSTTPYRYFKLTVTKSATYYIYSVSSYDMYGYLYDASHNQLTSNDDGGTNTNFQISYSLVAGTTYYVGARQYSSGTATFALVIDNTGVTSCFLPGTKITLADGTAKAIEDITYNDELLVWDFDEGAYGSAKPCWLTKSGLHNNHYYQLTFDDGTVLKTTGLNSNHRVYNVDECKFKGVDKTKVGDRIFSETGIRTVVDKEYIEADIEYYNIITSKKIDCFAEGILTSDRYGNLYSINSNMKWIKDGRETRPYSEFKAVGITEYWYENLRLSETTDTLEDVVDYIEKCESQMRLLD